MKFVTGLPYAKPPVKLMRFEVLSLDMLNNCAIRKLFLIIDEI